MKNIKPMIEAENSPAQILLSRYEEAKKKRNAWLSLWQECYDYALPQNASFTNVLQPGRERMAKLYDATALDAADQLAASLLGHLTPPWSQWFGLKPGPELSPAESEAILPALERASAIIQSHFDRSNFIVEMHQCFLDLVVGGTASLQFEEEEPGAYSAFRFCAIPLSQIVLEEGAGGALDASFRRIEMSAAQMKARYPDAVLPTKVEKAVLRDPQAMFTVLEAVVPQGLAHAYAAFVEVDGSPTMLSAGRFAQTPVISFRWMKSPGEIYGRSPVMKALPDIKTANKVVELILKNASIAVTGIWQADDDGVLNPANIELVPGSIIPKAVGSKGLQPLEMPGRFDVSQLMLDSLQARIRRALMADKFLPVAGSRMTATEVLERATEISILLGATYGRLQSELLTPLIKRAYAILRRRGEVPDLSLDGRLVSVDYRSPLARMQGQRDVQSTLSWINSMGALGAGGAMMIDVQAVAEYLAGALAVPPQIVRKQGVQDVQEAR